MATRKWDPKETDRDVLRARFTVWLDTTLSRASARFRNQMKDDFPEDAEVFSIHMLSADMFADTRDPYAGIHIGKPDFDFAEERIANALAELPLARREVLRLLFVERLSPKEIAKLLNCSEGFVSVQKLRALDKLRAVLEKGDRDDDKY